MKAFINHAMIALINKGGTASDIGDRIDVLLKNGLPVDKNADNVIISGCLSIFMYPHVFRSLSNVLEKCGSSFTFLSKEYCCGSYLWRSALKAGDEEDWDECSKYSKQFIDRNIVQARNLGTKRIIVGCSMCYSIYKYLYPQENIVYYPEILAECLPKLWTDKKIDYYPGCYKFHRKLFPVPTDLVSTEQVFAKIQGLIIHRIEAKACCFKPAGIAHLVTNSCAETQVHVCTGCYSQAKKNVTKDVEVLMLPELVERLIEK